MVTIVNQQKYWNTVICLSVATALHGLGMPMELGKLDSSVWILPFTSLD